MKAKSRNPKKAETHSLFVLRLFVCIFTVGILLFFYIEKQNELTELRLAIPILAEEVKNLHKENMRLTYDIESFENPIHLMELIQKPEFSHLKYPVLSNQIFLSPGKALSEPRYHPNFSTGE